MAGLQLIERIKFGGNCQTSGANYQSSFPLSAAEAGEAEKRKSRGPGIDSMHLQWAETERHMPRHSDGMLIN